MSSQVSFVHLMAIVLDQLKLMNQTAKNWWDCIYVLSTNQHAKWRSKGSPHCITCWALINKQSEGAKQVHTVLRVEHYSTSKVKEQSKSTLYYVLSTNQQAKWRSKASPHCVITLSVCMYSHSWRQIMYPAIKRVSEASGTRAIFFVQNRVNVVGATTFHRQIC